MKGSVGKIAAALMMLFGLALLTASLHAQSTFVYTNNYSFNGSNSVSAFSVGADGALTPVTGSPFPTGGSAFSAAGAFTATNRIAVTTMPGNFLYASNDVSNSISGFSIDITTGVLTAVPGSPFATVPASCPPNTCVLGIPLAATPNGQFLYAGNTTSNSISAFNIAANGALTPVPGSPFPAVNAVNIKVTPDGRFLAVAQISAATMFNIGSDGTLTPVAGPPFPGSGHPEGFDVNCASNLLFAPTGLFGLGGVDVLNIDSNGVLTSIAGSPFTFSGSFSLDEVLSPDDQHLFVSNLFSNTITVLNVASGGSLTEVSGSPFPTGAALPVTMATNQAGTLLYVSILPTVGVFPNLIGLNIDGKGALSPVPGSPFSTAVPGLPSVAVFPPKTCRTPFAAFAAKVEVERESSSLNTGVEGGFTLGSASNGIAPLTEAVSFQIGNFSSTIPAGSFHFDAVENKFEFEGLLNGTSVEASIKPTLTPNTFRFEIEVKGMDLTGGASSVAVQLTIGNDTGTTTAAVETD